MGFGVQNFALFWIWFLIAHLGIQIGVEAVTEGSAQKGMGVKVQPPEPQEVFQEVTEPSTAKKEQVVVNPGVGTENCGNEVSNLRKHF